MAGVSKATAGRRSADLPHYKVLAITLLENANIGENTHQSAEIQLLHAAEYQRKKVESSICFPLSWGPGQEYIKTLFSTSLFFLIANTDDVLSGTEHFQQVASTVGVALATLIGVIS